MITNRSGREAGPGGGYPWAIIQHVAHEGPGLIGEAIVNTGAGVEVVRMDRGDSLPEVGSISGLVVMGGPMGVHDDRDHPWLDLERHLIAGTVRSALPVLGVCLGAQQVAVALGGEVTSGIATEIGAGSVILTHAGRRDPVLGPEYGGLARTEIPCFHWHHDAFTLPDGAVHLAATQVTPNQAFRIGANVYGFQFHLEVDADLAAGWKPLLPDGVELLGSEVEEMAIVGRRVLHRYFDMVQYSAGGPTREPARR